MIWGIGTDIVEVERMRAAVTKGDALAKRVLTEREFVEYTSATDQPAFLAKRFAAKEAVVKAVGSGIGNGFGWQHMQVEHDKLGRPLLQPLGELSQWCKTNQILGVHISISDEKEYAIAYALIESEISRP